MAAYNTITLLKAIEQMPPKHTFLRDTFFPNVDTFPTKEVEIEYKKGKRTMAPFVAPRKGGKIVTRQGYKTKKFEPVKIAPERPITIDDITSKMIGENVYSKKTPDKRAKELLAKDMVELDDTIVRREEWMCREILLTGQVTAKDEDYEQVIDFKHTNKKTLTLGARWSEETADPYDDLDRERENIIKETGEAPDVGIMDSEAARNFIKHPKVKEMFENRRINLGKIEPIIKNKAVTFLGKIDSLNLELYSYVEWFIDDDGVEKPILPSGTVIIGTTGKNKRLYGAVTQMEKNEDFATYEGDRVPKVWADRANECKMVRVTSKPLPVPENVDSWAVLTVL